MSRSEFDEWLYANHSHLRHYQAWEVARVALACGFKMADIAPDVTRWIAISRRKLIFYANPLMEQWVDLWRYQRGNGDWLD